MTTKKVLMRVLFWFGLAAVFNVGIYIYNGPEKALEFLGGYIIEQSLSLDNLFLFLIIFSGFGIGATYQKRVLTYGIAGAIILRLIFIVLGVAVVQKFHWLLYVFGIILIFTGLKILIKKEKEKDYKNSPILKFFGRFIPFTENLEGEKFFVRMNKKLYATPLFAILLLVEGSDIIFAIDSIPAIFSITTDTFIVYTSNVFAILGLRNLYFLLERVNEAFRFVKKGVALILTFTGIKLSILFFHIEIPILLSIGIIIGILLLSILASVFYARYKARTAKA